MVIPGMRARWWLQTFTLNRHAPAGRPLVRIQARQDRCGKWRVWRTARDLPEGEWFCNLNEDTAHNSCAAAEDAGSARDDSECIDLLEKAVRQMQEGGRRQREVPQSSAPGCTQGPRQLVRFY